MPRGRKKKTQLKLDLKFDVFKSILAVTLFAVGILSFIAFFASGHSLNAKIVGFWTGLFGSCAIIAPVFVLFLASFFVDALKVKIKEPRVLIGITLLFITVLGLAHIFIPENKAYDASADGKGGGYVGYVISSVLRDSISLYGGVIVLVCLLIISVVVLFNVSLDQIVEKLQLIISKFSFIGNLKFKGKKSVDDSSIEIRDGISMDDDFEDEDEEPSMAYTKEAPMFGDSNEVSEDFTMEVVPTMSEPQSEVSTVSHGTTLSTLAPQVVTPTLPYVDKVWKNPSLDLLTDVEEGPIDNGDVEARAKKIREALKSFGIDVDIADVKSGPSVTQYALKAESGTKVSKIASLQNDLAMALASPTGSVRIEAPIPGKSLIGIEVPNNTRAVVSIKSLLSSEPMKAMKSKIGMVLGKDVAGKVYVADLAKMPHMLIAGTTGSGKSVFLHNVLFSMLFRASPQEVKFILIDPKRVELAHYRDIPHLLTPVVTDMSKAPGVFKWAVDEMDRRYKLFESAHARNIDAYNEKSGFQALPYIVIVVDELAEIMIQDPAGVEKSIIRIAQLARATGIHLILALQRPSTNIVTGMIKANIPSRIAFNVASRVDSQVIIDQPGAEKLLGKGDMLFVPPDISKPMRLQGAFVSDKEISNLVDYLKSQGIAPNYRDDVTQAGDSPQNGKSAFGGDVDELFDQAVDIVVMAKRASSSLLQTKLSIGYARAARILEQLEENGIVGPANGAKPREVLLDSIPGKNVDLPELDDIDHSSVNSIS